MKKKTIPNYLQKLKNNNVMQCDIFSVDLMLRVFIKSIDISYNMQNHKHLIILLYRY